MKKTFWPTFCPHKSSKMLLLILGILVLALFIWWTFFVQNKFHYTAAFYDKITSNFEKSLSAHRARFVPLIEGHCLDVAAGTLYAIIIIF